MRDEAAARRMVAGAAVNAVPSRNHAAPHVAIPADLAPAVGGRSEAPVSSQAAFGAVMLDLARGRTEFADRLLTMAPDVTTTTSLGLTMLAMAGLTSELRYSNSTGKTACQASFISWKT